MGRLTSTPPFPEALFIDRDGCPETHLNDDESWIVFNTWRNSQPCPHKDFCLVNHHLGNMSAIGFTRSVVKQLSSEPEEEYPILWSKVIYSGTHAGDFLSPAQAVMLGVELERLRLQTLPRAKEDYVDYWLQFLSMLEELVGASRSVGKPISF